MIGEALRIKEAKAGEGRQARLTAEAEGRKAAADALQKEKEAEAAGERAKLLAQATGREAQGKAEGAAKLAVLSAEADGLDKKNRALAELTDGARAIITLELLPGLVTHAGEAGEKIATAMFESVGLGLSKIDEVRIVDLGGTNGSDSASPVARFAGTVPEVVFGFLKRAEALGIDVNGVLEKLGIDAAGLVTLATKKSAAQHRASQSLRVFASSRHLVSIGGGHSSLAGGVNRFSLEGRRSHDCQGARAHGRTGGRVYCPRGLWRSQAHSDAPDEEARF